MQRFLMLLGIGILAAMTAQDFSRAQTAGKSGGRSSEAQYSVLNPWAEVDLAQAAEPVGKENRIVRQLQTRGQANGGHSRKKT